MGKKSKRRQTSSSAKGRSNPMAEARRIRTNEAGEILMDAYYQFSSLVLSSEGLGVIDLNKTVNFYTEFRRHNQFLPIQILRQTMLKCDEALIESGEQQEMFEINQFIISLLEDHEDFVKRHVSIDYQFLLHHKFVSACAFFRNDAKSCSYSERVLPHILAQSEEEGFNHSKKAIVLAEYADFCKKIGKYDDSKKYYDEALLTWKVSLPYEGCMDDFEFMLLKKDRQASILISQADLALTRSIAEKKSVAKEARRDSINNWNAASELYQEIIENTKPRHVFVCIESAISSKSQCHLLMAIQYGKLKQWNDAEENFERAIGQNDSAADIAMVRMRIGRLYFDRYIHNSTTVDGQHDENLSKAIIQTSIASHKFETLNAKSPPIFLDRAHQSYFLGHIYEAIDHAISYLKIYVKIRTGLCCNACNQPHLDGEVKHYCKACNAAFYCNRVCQYQDWRGENQISAKHRSLCPLVKAWKQLCEMRPEVEDMASQDIDPIIKNTRFEDMFKRYFESLRK